LGRGLRNAVGRWFAQTVKLDDLAHQAVKYQQRDAGRTVTLLRLRTPEGAEP